MCGIVGYIGNGNALEPLLSGLEKLEYRGYDSAGIALRMIDGTCVFKEKGRIATLRAAVDQEVRASVGIGHTRWATHGVPSKRNAHPHQSESERFTVVHNGVIENADSLKKDHLVDVTFASDTDTEVIVQLVARFVEKDGLQTEAAVRQALSLMTGSYAIAFLDSEEPETIFVAKNKSPLLVGVGHDANVVASDAMAMLSVTDQFLEIDDGELVLVQRDAVAIKSPDGTLQERAPYKAELDASDIEKGMYDHFMLKEIDEQSVVLRNIIRKYQHEDGSTRLDNDIRAVMQESDRIYIVAAGTSYHAGLVGKQLIERIAHKPVEVHIASELVYNMPLLSKKPLFVFISQSGETADSRAVLVEVKKRGYQTLTITNVPGSTLSREADFTLHTFAGPEIAVASTKAYTAQMAVLTLLAVDTARAGGIELDFDPLQELGIVANAIESLCNQKETFEEVAKTYLMTTHNTFFIGRASDYYVVLEGALKLKEISYIQAEGFAGGELKHGTIALIEEGTPVIALATQAHINLSIRSNVQEVVTRGAAPIIIAMEGLAQPDDTFVLPRVHEWLAPLVSVVPLQLIAYYAALHRGCDVDKPRNLAKSVTVE